MRIWWKRSNSKLGGMTPAQWLTINYPHKGTQVLAKELSKALEVNVSPKVIESTAGRYGIHKTVQCIREIQDGFRPAPLIPNLPAYTDIDHIDSPVMIAGDFQVPFYSRKWTERLVKVAKWFGIKKLIIGGDFWNFDTYSKFVHEQPMEATKEIDWGKKIQEYLLSQFDWILMLMGNHERRLYSGKLEKSIGIENLKDLLTAWPENVFISKYAYCEVNARWRVTHPKNYSQLRGRVANKLAAKYHKNIVTFHGHMLNLGHDDSGDYMVIDGGGMFDEDYIEYRKVEDSTYPAWANGFVVIDGNDEIHLFNDIWTPWKTYERMFEK